MDMAIVSFYKSTKTYKLDNFIAFSPNIWHCRAYKSCETQFWEPSTYDEPWKWIDIDFLSELAQNMGSCHDPPTKESATPIYEKRKNFFLCVWEHQDTKKKIAFSQTLHASKSLNSKPIQKGGFKKKSILNRLKFDSKKIHFLPDRS